MADNPNGIQIFRGKAVAPENFSGKGALQGCKAIAVIDVPLEDVIHEAVAEPANPVEKNEGVVAGREIQSWLVRIMLVAPWTVRRVFPRSRIREIMLSPVARLHSSV